MVCSLGLSQSARVVRQDDGDDELPQTPEQLCEDRNSNEYFRLRTDADCRDVVRCDQAGPGGAIRLAAVRCPAGLAFDIYRQTCDWKAKVSNCDLLESNNQYCHSSFATCKADARHQFFFFFFFFFELN